MSRHETSQFNPSTGTLHTFPFVLRSSSIVGLSLLVLLLNSCGGRPTGVVSGKITYNNQPLSLGTVAMIAEDGTVASGMISDGRYKVEEVPVGPAKIMVHVYPPSPMMHPPTGPAAGAKQKPRLTFVPIPDRYTDASRSGLTYTVAKGPQTHDLVLGP
ncbi:MAG: hypothetical protein U9N87_09680 [Planctomycetota bacterium]|nr:hypothetical protein [Planctomycetota bacterium]MEA3340150.1 hypothetical protein [Chloroflexota bacterium]